MLTISETPQWTTLKQQLVKSAVVVLSLSLLTNVTLLALPVYSVQIFDRVVTSQSQETLWMLFIAAIICLATMIGLDALRRKVFVAGAQALAKQLSIFSLHQLGQQSLHGDKPTSPNSQLTPDHFTPQRLMQLQKALQDPAYIGLIDALLSPLFLALLFFIHPLFGLSMLIVNVLFVALVIQQHHALSANHIQMNNSTKQTQHQLLTLQQHYASQWTRGKASSWVEKTDAALQQHNHAQALQQQRKLSSHTYIAVIRTASQLMIPTIGAILVIQQHISGGLLLAAIIIGMKSVTPWEQVIGQWQTLLDTRSLLTSLKTALTREASQPRRQTPISLFSGQVSLELNTPSEQTFKATFEPGSCSAIIGPSGAGKSDLLRAIAGLPYQSSHAISVKYDGIDITTLNRHTSGTNIAYVTQASLAPMMSIRDFVGGLQSGCDAMVLSACQRMGLSQKIQKLPLGYDTIISEHPQTSSRGFLQQLAIAQAVCFQPRFLIMDEADTTLDKLGVEAFERMIQDQKRLGTTVILSSQRKGLLPLTDSILLLDDHQPVFHGASHQLNTGGNAAVLKTNVHTLMGQGYA